jgi:hypothetical protein
MPTLLELANEVLLQVGEHPVNDFTSPVALKAKLACQLSLQFCSTLHGWMFLRQTVSTSSWVNGVATITPFQKVYQVSHFTNVLSRQRLAALRQLNVRSPYTANPSYYAIVGENQILLYPQPVTADKPIILFDILAHITIPQLPTDSFTYPQAFLNIVSLYAQATMHRTHTADTASMEACMRTFELAVHMYRTREDDAPGNMHP